MPGSTRRNSAKLRTSRPAATRRTTDKATSTVTNADRNRPCDWPAVAERPPCFNPSVTCERAACHAGTNPVAAPVIKATAAVNTKTQPLSAISELVSISPAFSSAGARAASSPVRP